MLKSWIRSYLGIEQMGSSLSLYHAAQYGMSFNNMPHYSEDPSYWWRKNKDR